MQTQLMFQNQRINENPLLRYQRGVKIGEGTYGQVYKTIDQYTKEVVALKRMILEIKNEGVPSNIIREISTLKEIQHPNVVTLKDIVIHEQKLYLIFEYIDQDLRQMIESYDPFNYLDPYIIKKIMYQLLNGIAACHQRRIIHRDLKPQNILIDNNFQLKIADFGLARTFCVPIRPYTHEVVTLFYRAPEILLGSNEYSTPVDIWSAGCIFAELVTKQPLFQGDCEIGQLFKIFQLLGTPNEKIWPGVSLLRDYKSSFPQFQPKNLQSEINLDPLGIDLFKQLMIYDPCKRISAYSALEHPYFNELKTSEQSQYNLDLNQNLLMQNFNQFN